MTQSEEDSASFVVRIWLEKREIADAPKEWRGVIVHVSSGKRQYIRELDEIVVFVAEYFSCWGLAPRSWALIRKKLRRFAPQQLLSWARR